MVDDEPEFKSQKYWTQKLTTTIVLASCSTLSAGQVMKAPTKKLHGYSLLSQDMLLNLSQTSMQPIWPNLVPCQDFLDLICLIDHTFSDL